LTGKTEEHNGNVIFAFALTVIALLVLADATVTVAR
jgi:hypothetical protein